MALLPLFLSRDEVIDLTGYKRNADQRRWLTEHGWQFSEAANGRPVVGRAYAEAKMGTSATQIKPVTLNLAAIRKSA